MAQDPRHRRIAAGKFRSYALASATRWPGRGRAWRRAWPRCAPRPSTRCARGDNILILSTAASTPTCVADTGAAGHQSRVHQHLIRRPAHPRASSSRPARRARCTTSPCWPATAPRRSTPTWPSRRCADMLADGYPDGIDAEKAVKNYIKAVGKGAAKGDVQDGHLDLQSLLRRADLRGRRPDARRWSTLFHRHRQPHRAASGLDVIAEEALRRTKPPSRRPRAADAARRRRRVPVARAARTTCGTPTSIAKLQHATRADSYADYKEYAQLINDQTARNMTLRGLFEFKIEPAEPSRSTRSSRPRRSSSASSPAPCSFGSISTRGARTRWPSP